jgi:protein involved in polysaccharide export with SLBB domain
MLRFVTVFIFLLLSTTLHSQNFDNLQGLNAGQTQFSDKPAQYILGSGDILLVNINLWGHVQRPGIYSVPSSYTLIDLISSAGGPLSTARLNDVRVVRKDQEVLKIDIEKFLKTGDNSLLPILQPGDTIIVAGSIQDIFMQIVGIFRDMAIIANVFVLSQRLK